LGYQQIRLRGAAMPGTTAFVTFLLALLALELTPGPDMMLVTARGIGQGRRVALLTVVGTVLVAGPIQIAALVLGLASLLQAHPASLVVI
jgi:threonine/homoserine/homoserine lactone efflux protein